MEILKILAKVIEYTLLVYFGFASVYIFIFSFAAIFSRSKKAYKESVTRKFAVLIPGYKEDSVIVEVAEKALQQTYSKNDFDVVVIADSFLPQTLEKLRALPIKLVEVSFEKSTKSKALNKAMEVIGDDYDVALILDADNIMENDFITKINKAFDQGFKVVQGHRAAKNVNTNFAILDAISEEVNNSIFRKGHRTLGLSSALIGSGMAFDYHFFKSTMANVNAVGGFDKELELKLLKEKNQIEYIHDAIVLDEKVQKAEVFENQRKRWLSAQFVYFRRYIMSGLKELFLRGNIDFFDKVYQMITPPRILLLGIVSLITGIYVMADIIFSSVFSYVPPVLWYGVFTLTVLAFALAIPKKFYNKATLKAVITLPKAFFVMFLSLFKLKGANKKFIHTQHGKIES
ncbi:Glycosyltransferase, catalytic subunit of cellulose synthase and poly-beta-1,6-N-acetylglucosamine synthase [Pustulibacterium marinum]|uniref:Glycosyltransferase, catalytic subunit of cellulose synthase and poly-beta-1,6-N-acetylglucosamine synthase n=1 Tax=Pustulibacterium marinum TaxID=1224947 RepID=A0A1I7GEC9_9FLAO|nr:glycosyltransferase family 2 protein [Pustulibacterium marinum]SFU46671.1 Glycosyltransferase, catalytic subunit of cellulose synthase and poly-beta-1,6-N-acetylglucosamine synthase [Pustulibacterium marinum]